MISNEIDRQAPHHFSVANLLCSIPVAFTSYQFTHYGMQALGQASTGVSTKYYGRGALGVGTKYYGRGALV